MFTSAFIFKFYQMFGAASDLRLAQIILELEPSPQEYLGKLIHFHVLAFHPHKNSKLKTTIYKNSDQSRDLRTRIGMPLSIYYVKKD